MGARDIGFDGLALSYLLLIPPLLVLIRLRIPLVGKLLLAVLRMTLQLLFVGFYLQVIFEMDSAILTCLWLMIMIGVADLTILRGVG